MRTADLSLDDDILTSELPNELNELFSRVSRVVELVRGERARRRGHSELLRLHISGARRSVGLWDDVERRGSR